MPLIARVGLSNSDRKFSFIDLASASDDAGVQVTAQGSPAADRAQSGQLSEQIDDLQRELLAMKTRLVGCNN